MASKRTEKHTELTDVAAVDESPDSVARRTFIVLSVATGFILLAAFLFEIRAVLLLLFISLVFTLALHPLVDWLTKHRMSRGIASFLAVLVSLTVLLGVLTAAAAPLISQTTRLIDNFPQLVDDAMKNATVKKLDDKYQIKQKAEETAESAPRFITGSDSTIVGTIRTTFGALANIAIIITLTFFLLLEGPRFWHTILSSQRKHSAERIDRLGNHISKAVGGFVSGNLFISLVAGIFSFILLTLLGVPYAFPLAVLIALFDLIPMVGASIATILVALVVMTVGIPATIIFVSAMIIYQNVEGHAIIPLVYSRTVSLSPLLVLVATVIGADLGGILGVLLAIPVAAIVQILFLELAQQTAAGRRAHIKEG